ncbi:MAG: putative bifunctional transcriptional activator/DNA repair enzyme AlkA [Luteibacter sp.]|uniref:bifunctional transcriptional activator/DNA repair enzyme AdaA n=1 Tax=Luteibacter sp. TaxID=1886636 RepID=UPI001384E648|nr:bifunctional transcriptional activator/DNA repair enzyme AdaA [Luteibacter sp.]KAF1006281.1 MAG: putative bifunctional transcriptional activator/DNA repair enzyme AlkA [Luteibacter sp.]
MEWLPEFRRQVLGRPGTLVPMLFDLPDHETLYRALLERDPSYDGHIYVGVTSTGVFCRLSCPARKPNIDNTRFYDSVAACFEGGFRPCLRCRPLDPLGQREPMVSVLLGKLEDDPERIWSEDDLVALGYDPSTVRRTFKRHLGLTFLDMARLRRTSLGMDKLAGGASVIEAQQSQASTQAADSAMPSPDCWAIRRCTCAVATCSRPTGWKRPSAPCWPSPTPPPCTRWSSSTGRRSPAN